MMIIKHEMEHVWIAKLRLPVAARRQRHGTRGRLWGKGDRNMASNGAPFLRTPVSAVTSS